MKKLINIIVSKNFIEGAMVIEMITFAVIVFIKIGASVNQGSGWIPLSVLEVPKLIILLLANIIAVPSLYDKMKIKESATRKDKITFLLILCAFIGGLLIIEPLYWLLYCL